MTKQISAKQRTETTLPPMNFVGFLRWNWRQLTSMNTALLLLVLVALAAIPGSILPQRTASILKVNNWKTENPRFAEIFDALGLFDVYGSFWFSAIYILLMISLIGCVIPRLNVYWKSFNEKPPKPPKEIDRFAGFQKLKINKSNFNEIESIIKKLGWRVNRNGNALTAEKGYTREAGNLVFHASLILLTVALAFGALFSYRGTIIVKEGNGFANTLTQFDDFRAGKLFSIARMPNFYFTLNDFVVDFERGINQRGAPRKFEANITLNAEEDLKVLVNRPFTIDGTKVFLTGHGYAPRIEVINKEKEIIFSDSVTFLPQDANFTSTGVIKIADNNPQLGINAQFFPTAALDPVNGLVSVFPELDNPQLALSLWQGNLGVDEGIAQSIYRLDTSKMTQLESKELVPGQTWQTAAGYEIKFVAVEQFATFQVAYEPGRFMALVGAILAMVGMFFGLGVQRRRIWVLMPKSQKGSSVIEVAGLSKSNSHDVTKDIDKVLQSFGIEKKKAKRSRSI
ncbi:MAG: cytochrome c biogenesis protein ResB [Actinomycetes bacterium]|jgi:cytochrome c biogenesis protein